jgi:hypothetical protein
VTQARTVALLTPSYHKDLERFALLCDSIDRYVKGHERHYVVVADDEIPLFSRFNSERRKVLPSSMFLPKWLKLVPPFLLRQGRRLWWSFRSGPVHGWHIQQLLKISAVSSLPEQRFCVIDSDNVFFRPFDASAYAGAMKAPLYVEHAAIEADAPLHAAWMRSCDRLLGQAKTAFPADDYIGHVIVWDQRTVRDLTQKIAAVAKRDWKEALCKTRALSEYLLYGHFVRNSPTHLQTHEIVTAGLVHAYWDAAPLDAPAVVAMIARAAPSEVALSVASFSNTPVRAIREAVGLSSVDTRAIGSTELAA